MLVFLFNGKPKITHKSEKSSRTCFLNKKGYVQVKEDLNVSNCIQMPVYRPIRFSPQYILLRKTKS